MLKALQRLMKRAALSAESLSRMPPSCLGWLATIPAVRPPNRARQVMIVLAHCGLRSKYSPSSTIRRITSYMSYGLRLESGRTSSSPSSARSIGSPVGGADEGLLDVLPDSNRKPYDMYEVIRRIVDDGEYFDLKPQWARTIITCLARFGGRT